MAKKMKPKGSSRRGAGAGLGGGMNNPGGLMAQFQKMQQEMAAAQTQLEDETVEVSVGGGAVVVVMTGHQRLQSLTINKEVVDLEDEDWLIDLQDLVAAAVNQAIEQSQALAAERMEGITGGMGDIPGLGGLLGG